MMLPVMSLHCGGALQRNMGNIMFVLAHYRIDISAHCVMIFAPPRYLYWTDS